MIFDESDLSSREKYRLLTGMVVPRPIAWVMSIDIETGVRNLAPFSCFTFVAYEPMLICFVIGRKGVAIKDTAANIHASGEFVTHIMSYTFAHDIHLTAIEYDRVVDESEVVGRETVASDLVKVPRLKDAEIALECRFESNAYFGPLHNELIVGRVMRIHVSDRLVKNGKIETVDLDPVARVAGPRYARVAQIVEFEPIAAQLGSQDSAS